MPTYSIELPDGRVMDAEAPDEATAIHGAKAWFAQNGAEAGTSEASQAAPGAPPSALSRLATTARQLAPGAGGEAGTMAGISDAISPRPKGVLEHMGISGASRTEFPDAPEFLQGYMASGRDPETGNVNIGEGGVNLAAVNRSAITPDPQAQLDILKRNIPGLESKTDAHGNLMLKAPGMADWTYLNKPGLSGRDIDELGTQTLATLPFAGLFGAGGSIPARIGTGALAGGGSSVALDVAATAQGSEQGIDPTRAAVSTGLGLVLGPVAGKATAATPATARQETLDAAGRIGVEVPRAVASDSRVVNAVAGGLGSTMLGSPLQGAARRTTQGLGRAAEGVAEGFGAGSSATSFAGGSAAKEGILSWITSGSKAVISKGYDELDKLLKPGTLVPLSNTQRAVKELTDLDMMSASTDGSRVINLVRGAVDRPGGLTYEGLKELRTRIGERVFGDIAPEQGTSARALDKIYAALSEDLKFGVKQAGKAKSGSSGKKALAAFERANTVARETFGIRDKLKSLVGAQGDVPAERIFDRIVQMAGAKGNADFQKLALARNAIGSEKWDEVASAVVTRLGRDKDGNFSPALFLRDYGRLSENGKNVLFHTTGKTSLKQSLDDVATVSRKFEDTIARFNNRSLTGNTILGTLGIGGVLSNPVVTLSSALGGVATSWMLSRPVTAKAAARWANAYLMAATTNNRSALLLINQAGRQLMEAMRSEGIEPQMQSEGR